MQTTHTPSLRRALVISIACIYNDKEILQSYLLRGLKAQASEYDLILIDNTANRFKSAAEGLNYGGQNAKGEYIMFVHQDVVLKSRDSLRLIETTLERLPNLGIAGAAGCIEGSEAILSNIMYYAHPSRAGSIPVTVPTRVQTLDECLIIVPKETFAKLKFDVQACDGWHLYAVDYSLSVRTLGLDAYVLPIAAYHRSRGRRQGGYHKILKRVLRKHRHQERRIFTTSSGSWDTRNPLLIQRIHKKAFSALQVLRRKGPIEFANKTSEQLRGRTRRIEVE